MAGSLRSLGRKRSIIPGGVSFPSVTAPSGGTSVVSNTVTVTKLTMTVPVEVIDGEVSINGGEWVTSGFIRRGQTLRVRATASAGSTVAVVKTVTVNIGGGTYNFLVTTPVLGDSQFLVTAVGSAPGGYWDIVNYGWSIQGGGGSPSVQFNGPWVHTSWAGHPRQYVPNGNIGNVSIQFNFPSAVILNHIWFNTPPGYGSREPYGTGLFALRNGSWVGIGGGGYYGSGGYYSTRNS